MVFEWWLENPSLQRGAFLGLVSFLALLTKFSAIPFLLAVAVAISASRWLIGRRVHHVPRLATRRLVSSLLLASIVVLIGSWGGYRFSVGALTDAGDQSREAIDRLLPPGINRGLAYKVTESSIWPAAAMVRGVGQLLEHNTRGHPAYLLGEVSDVGWWYFFPTAFLVKTPIPFMVLMLVGSVWLARFAWREQDWRLFTPLTASVAIMLSVLPSNINIGLRHILPLYPLLSIVAAVGLWSLVDAERYRWAARSLAVLLLLWHVGTSIATHPDYLAYFNEAAGRHPERILVDSDLDWGQDVDRLVDELRNRGIENISLALFSPQDLSYLELPPFRLLHPYERVSGWIAASLFHVKATRGYQWLDDHEPVVLVGNSIRLYFIREEELVDAARNIVPRVRKT
jgi:hypothetical protein